MENSIQTVLSISNSDIVTMLIVKQKEFLKSRLPVLIEQKKSILHKYILLLEDNIKTRLEENKDIVKLTASVKALVEIYNPNIPFTITLYDTPLIWATRRVNNIFGNRGNRMGYHGVLSTVDILAVGPLPNLYISAKDERDENKFDRCLPSDVPIPEESHLATETISLSEQDVRDLDRLNEKIANIENFLRDDKRIHEQIVAQMTEKAIESNQELKKVLSGVKLLV